MSSALISLGAALHSFMPAVVRSHGKHKRSRSMPAYTAHPILADFQNQLGAKVEILMQQQQQPESYNFSAAWLGQVLDVVLFIYSNVKDLYPQMQIDNNLEGKWLRQHMEDLVNLLDVCNVLRESISEIKKHNTSVQIALHGLFHAHTQNPCALNHDHMMNIQVVKAKKSLGSCSAELRKNKDMKSKLAKCMSTLKRMADGLQYPTTETATSMGGSGVEEGIKEAKAITIFSCTAIAAALSFNTPCRSFMPFGAGSSNKSNKISPTPLIPPLIDINSMTNMMEHKIKEAMEMQRKRSSSLKFLLHELNRADITFGSLNNLLDKYTMNKTSSLQDELKDSIHAVNMSATELESALNHIDHRISELFRFLISSRVALLNSLATLS